MNDSEKYLWELAWKHFHYHAEQRLKAFNFFVVVETFMIAGTLAANQGNAIPEIIVIAGVVIIFMSWIFYGLDQRNRQLVKLAEATLEQFEQKFPCQKNNSNSLITLFAGAENQLTANKRPLSLSYNQSFRAFYLLSASIGLLAIGYAIIKLYFTY